MNTAIKPITPEREQELVAKLVDFLSSRYDAGNLYDILRHGLGMDHSDMEALGFPAPRLLRGGMIMKKENVTITFESEQLAALEFSLKKKTPACRRSWRNCSNVSTNPRCRSRCGNISPAAQRPLPVPAVRQGRRSRRCGRSLLCVGNVT